MSVFQRPGRAIWWFEFEYRGRRYRESAGTKSKTLAIEIERKRRREVEESANGIRRNRNAAVLLSVAAADWLTFKKPTWADKTYVIEKANIEHLKPHFGKLLLTEITDHDIARYQEHRREEKAANKTTNNEVATLGHGQALPHDVRSERLNPNRGLRAGLSVPSAVVPSAPHPAFIGESAQSTYLSSRGSITCSPLWTTTMRLASWCAGFSRTLNVSGTIADGTFKSAAEPLVSHASPTSRVTSVFCGQSAGSWSTETRPTCTSSGASIFNRR